MAKELKSMVLEPVGVIHTPYRRREDIPRQGRLCTHLFVIYWLHLGDRARLTATPPPDGREHGVFATRSPNRPNLLALDIVKLLEVRGNRLSVSGIDALDGSILLDIKPYSAGIDCILEARIGWERDTGEKGDIQVFQSEERGDGSR